MEDRDKTVCLGNGIWQSRDLYGLLREAKAASGGMKKQPWPKDALTVPHNKW
jgi:hypothetical protein